MHCSLIYLQIFFYYQLLLIKCGCFVWQWPIRYFLSKPGCLVLFVCPPVKPQKESKWSLYKFWMQCILHLHFDWKKMLLLGKQAAWLLPSLTELLQLNWKQILQKRLLVKVIKHLYGEKERENQMESEIKLSLEMLGKKGRCNCREKGRFNFSLGKI